MSFFGSVRPSMADVMHSEKSIRTQSIIVGVGGIVLLVSATLLLISCLLLFKYQDPDEYIYKYTCTVLVPSKNCHEDCSVGSSCKKICSADVSLVGYTGTGRIERSIIPFVYDDYKSNHVVGMNTTCFIAENIPELASYFEYSSTKNHIFALMVVSAVSSFLSLLLILIISPNICIYYSQHRKPRKYMVLSGEGTAIVQHEPVNPIVNTSINEDDDREGNVIGYH